MDLFTVLPFDSLQLMGALPAVEGACGDSTGMLLKAVRIVRVARLLKLLRVLRASRIVTRWQSQLNLSSTTQSLFTAWFAFIILVHWLACLWALMPQLQNSWRDEPLVIAALEERVLRDPTCDACLCAGDRASEACSSPCLTPCEIEVAANVTHSARMASRSRSTKSASRMLPRSIAPIDPDSARFATHMPIVMDGVRVNNATSSGLEQETMP
jgi:hypothetical protein